MARDGNGEADGPGARGPARADRRCAGARGAAPRLPPADLLNGEAFIWHAEDSRLVPVHDINRLDLELLIGIDRPAATLMENTRRFAQGLPANNALLWGARGMGKSSLVKSVHGCDQRGDGRRARAGRGASRGPRQPAGIAGDAARVARRFILFCDDLSFEAEDTTFKSLKALLEGGIEGTARPT